MVPQKGTETVALRGWLPPNSQLRPVPLPPQPDRQTPGARGTPAAARPHPQPWTCPRRPTVFLLGPSHNCLAPGRASPVPLPASSPWELAVLSEAWRCEGAAGLGPPGLPSIRPSVMPSSCGNPVPLTPSAGHSARWAQAEHGCSWAPEGRAWALKCHQPACRRARFRGPCLDLPRESRWVVWRD